MNRYCVHGLALFQLDFIPFLGINLIYYVNYCVSFLPDIGSTHFCVNKYGQLAPTACDCPAKKMLNR